jgi:hypothetical protein
MSGQELHGKSNSWYGLISVTVLSLLGCMLVTETALAGPEAYGTRFIRVDETLPGSTGAPGGSAAVAPTDKSRYREQMEAAELEAGPYADALAEPLAALARGHRQDGDYEQALATYRRALHIVRVNDGLYSERQIPLLREMLITYRESGDLEGLDQRYEYFFRVYGMGQPPYTPLRLRAALEYLRWQREALLLDLPGNPERRILDLIALNAALAETVMADPAAPFSWKRDLVLSQVANLYLLQDQFEPSIDETSLFRGRELVDPTPLVESLDDQRMDNALRSAYMKGRLLLEGLQSEEPGLEAAERASLALALADWHHWNGSRERATQAYVEVVDMLQQAGEASLLEQWLGEPVELPDNGTFLLPVASRGLREQVRARFDVSEQGRVRSIETETLSGDAVSGLGSFRRRLAATLFRPRWSTGQATAVEGLQRDYRLLD